MLRLVIIAACAATVQAACDAIEVAGTDSDISTGSFDGLYDQAGACNGQPYYKCTCCTDYDQFLIDKCATPGECDEGWSETRCMSDSPSGGWHHYLWYSSDDEAWQLRMYVGGGADDDGMFAWDECGGSSTFSDEYRLADPDGDLAAAAASTSWEWEGDSWEAHAMTATCAAASVSPPPTFATAVPTFATAVPSSLPSAVPSSLPTTLPTAAPTSVPSATPTGHPSEAPTYETWPPTGLPTTVPSSIPTALPTSVPSSKAVWKSTKLTPSSRRSNRRVPEI